MNIRYHLLKWASLVTGNGIFRAYQQTLQWDSLSPKAIKRKQEQLLMNLLVHAFHHVPYYRKTLNEHGIYNGQGVPELSRFDQLPFLTKDIIREQFDQLLSDDWRQLGGQFNTSGGSTGEPVQFIQDKAHRRWCVYANKLYYNHMLGKQPGEKELLLWGSDRDILRGSIGLKAKLINLIYNRRFLNAYRMSAETMRDYVRQINTFKPVSIWAYVESLELLAQFIQENRLTITSPKMVVTTAGTLYPHARDLIERVFSAPLHNQYGSREVGPIACQCQAKDQLHSFPWTHFVEIISDDGDIAQPGEEGEVVITNLVNYAMPLIRYKIGDRAIQPKRPCKCGQNSFTLANITGRVSEHLIAIDGTKVYAQFFIHLFFNRSWLKKYQVIQTRKEKVVNKLVVSSSPPKHELDVIIDKQKQILGKNMIIEFLFVDHISTSSSGKYLYVINLLSNKVQYLNNNDV